MNPNKSAKHHALLKRSRCVAKKEGVGSKNQTTVNSIPVINQ
jgi:hypothetical protein